MSSALDDIFATNKTTEEDGAWVNLTPTIRLKIRAFNAKVVTDLREKLMKPYVLLQRSGQKIPDETSDDIGLKVIAGGVLSDWDGIESEGVEADEETGQNEVAPAPIAYSADEAYAVLKRLPRLANFVVGISTDAQFYKDEVLAGAVKN
jgi:hypothetical protein